MEIDLGVDEYLKGEKHQMGRHVTMLVILLVMMVVVSGPSLKLDVVHSTQFYRAGTGSIMKDK